MPTPTCSMVKSSAGSSISRWHNLSSPALVLVHGGEHSADCWDLTIDELRQLAPELPVLAVDMPGHGATPGDLTTVTIADCVRSAVEQIEEAGLSEVIVVGHSLAGLTGAQRRFTLTRLHPEAATIITEPVDRSDLPDDVPRTWILTLRDQALFRRVQLRSIAALGGVQTLIPVDTCHDLMISEPALLAEILIERCQLRSADS